MAEVTKTHLRGFLIPDRLVVAHDSSAVVGTDVTQAGPRAGRPVLESSADSAMVLEATGTQDAGSKLEVQTQRGGYAEPGGAGFVWRHDTSPAETYRGWDTPILATGWEAVAWTSTLLGDKRYPHAVVTEAGAIVVVYTDVDLTVAGGESYVYARIRSATTGTWGSEITVATNPGQGYAYPSIVRLPSGRLQVFFVVYDSGASLAQVSMSYSDDDGATWTTGSRYCLPAAISTATYTLQRLRAAHANGQHVLVMGLRTSTDAQITQWASDDNGSRFELVEDFTADNPTAPGLVAAGGYFVLAYTLANQIASGGGAPGFVARIGSAFSKFSASADVGLTTLIGGGTGGGSAGSTYLTNTDNALSVDDDDVLYLWARAFRTGVGGRAGVVLRSEDYGATWEALGSGDTGTGAGVWYNQNDASTYPTEFSVVHHRGRAVMLHNWAANPGDEDWSVGALYLGGYSTVTLPGVDLLISASSQVSWLRTYLPLDLPGDVGWTKATTGTPSEALSAGALAISGGLTEAITYQWDTSAGPTVAEGLICRFRVDVSNGTIDWRIHNDDGSEDYTIELRIGTTSITLHDVNDALTQIASATGLGGSYDLLVGMADDRAVVWYREVGSDVTEDRVWVLLHEATGLTDNGGPVGYPRWKFGKARTGFAAAANVYEHHIVYDQYTGSGLAADLTRPDDLRPRTYSSTSPVYVADGVSLRAVDGPTIAGDTWGIDTEYEYPIDAILPSHSPSPRTVWRSTSTPGDMEIVFSRDALGSATGGYSTGIYLDNCNFPTASTYVKIAGTWYPSTSIDLTQTVDFIRVGGAVKPGTTTSGVSGYYLAEDQLAGSHFYFPTSGDVRRISGNSAGYWSNGTVDEQRAILFLEGCDGGEDASGTAGQIWFSRALIVIAPASEINIFQALRFEIDDGNTAVDPPSGYYQIGTFATGHIVALDDYDWGYSHEREAFVDVSEYGDGTIRTRRRGPTRRKYRISYGEGVDVTAARGSGNAPDYFRASTASGAPPVASANVAPLLLDGLLDALDGANSPVVFCPSIPVASGVGDQVTTLLWDRAGGALYGRITSSSVRLESVVGDDLEDELYRVATIEITEIT